MHKKIFMRIGGQISHYHYKYIMIIFQIEKILTVFLRRKFAIFYHNV